jgi:hypothetical protein
MTTSDRPDIIWVGSARLLYFVSCQGKQKKSGNENSKHRSRAEEPRQQVFSNFDNNCPFNNFDCGLYHRPDLVAALANLSQLHPNQS